MGGADWIQCANDNGTSPIAYAKLRQWDELFLKDAVKRLNKDMSGYELTTRDVRDFVSETQTANTDCGADLSRWTCALTRSVWFALQRQDLIICTWH